MAKKKQPAPKRGGKKKVAPKKAVKPSALPHVDVSEPQHPTVEEQAGSLFGGPGTVLARTTFYPKLPAPPPPTKRSKFWRQYQDTETGEFIGWRAAAKLTKDKVISRLRLRKVAR